MTALTIIKLGGAAITDKNTIATLRDEILRQVMTEIAQIEGPLVIVHGAGSFAHHHAKEYQLTYGYSDTIALEEQIKGMSLTRTLLQELHLAVLNLANMAGINTFPLAISAVMISKGAEEIYSYYGDTIKRALEMGFVPVLYGDMVFDEITGFRVVSGDRIIQILTRELPYDEIHVIFGSNVDGLYDKDPQDPDAQLIESLHEDEIDEFISAAGASAGVDVTGGMRGKMEQIKQILKYADSISLVNITVPGRLEAMIKGETVVSTRIIK